MSEEHCINCGLNLAGILRHTLEPEEILTMLLQWVAPQQLSRDDLICHNCWEVVSASLVAPQQEPDQMGRLNSCVNCGCSIRRLRSHLLRIDTDRENLIRNVIMEWIQPQELDEKRKARIERHRQEIMKQIDDKERARAELREKIHNEGVALRMEQEQQDKYERKVIKEKVAAMRQQKVSEKYVKEVEQTLGKHGYQ